MYITLVYTYCNLHGCAVCIATVRGYAPLRSRLNSAIGAGIVSCVVEAEPFKCCIASVELCLPGHKLVRVSRFQQ